jgi:uncharacterized damage-inducible protein DinB
MPASNLLDILLSHDRGATQKLLETCAGLSAEQFHQRFDMGPGSLHDTTTHILGAIRRWGDMLAGREQRPRLEGARRTPAELLSLLEDIASDFAATARAHPSEEIVSGSRDSKTYTVPRATVLSHVTTHAMHHRAQCLNMLRQLGVTPLPPSDVIQWARAADGQS